MQQVFPLAHPSHERKRYLDRFQISAGDRPTDHATCSNQHLPGADPKGGDGAMPPQTMDEKLKLSCRAYMLVLQLPLMTIKQLINIAV